MGNKTKIAIAGGLIALGGYFGADLLIVERLSPEELLLKKIEAYQEANIVKGRYKNTETAISDLSALNIAEKPEGTIQINEYKAPCGIGYEIVSRKLVDGEKYIMITAKGCEADSRNTNGWVKYVDDIENIKKQTK